MADNKHNSMYSRRRFIRNASTLALAAPLVGHAAQGSTGEGVTFAGGERPLVQFPEKRKLILVHSRPPHLETPFSTFNEGVITKNDAFYVRYHLANFPTSIDLADYRLNIRGAVKQRLSLSLDELKSIVEQIEVVARLSKYSIKFLNAYKIQ